MTDDELGAAIHAAVERYVLGYDTPPPSEVFNAHELDHIATELAGLAEVYRYLATDVAWGATP